VVKDVEISEFWDWFQSVCDGFGERFENSTLIDQLDLRVASLGGVSWEIGPAIDPSKENMLVITPCGNSDLLCMTKRIVSMAPDSNKWEFYYAKPPKNWQLLFFVADENGREIEVDASDWEYVLLRFPDGTIDIVIQAPSLSGLNDNLKGVAAEIALDGELGEEIRIKLLGEIEVVHAFETSMADKANPVRTLDNHLRSLAPEAPWHSKSVPGQTIPTILE